MLLSRFYLGSSTYIPLLVLLGAYRDESQSLPLPYQLYIGVLINELIEY